MLTYALGRGLKSFDAPALEKVEKAVEQNEYRFQPIIYEIVRSLPFQARRGEQPAEDARP
jgi:hypothetical protein